MAKGLIIAGIVICCGAICPLACYIEQGREDHSLRDGVIIPIMGIGAILIGTGIIL